MSALWSRSCRSGCGGCLLGLAWLLATSAAGQSVQAELTRTSPLLMDGERDGAPVILNEYNAVGPTKWLGGTSSSAADEFFGRVLGNGGNWFELVVTQDHLDMRGWLLEWREFTTPPKNGWIRLSSHAIWSDLRAGTIITIIEHATGHALGGLTTDTSFNPALGDWWLNFHTYNYIGGNFDRTYIQQMFTDVSGDTEGNFSVGNDNWQLRILDNVGNVKFGWCGEGIGELTGVNSERVAKLEENPGPYIDPITSDYRNGTSSTFGRPNRWSSGTMTQDFSGLRAPGNSIALVVKNTFDPLSAFEDHSSFPNLDEVAALPASDTTTFVQNSTYYVEVWAQTMHTTGLTLVSTDLHWDPARMQVLTSGWYPSGVFHTTLFNTLPHKVVDNATGMIDDLSGGYLPDLPNNCTTDPTGAAPNWSRVAVIRMKALQSGAHHLDLRWPNSQIYVFGVCGAVVDPDNPDLIEYRDLNEPTADLVLDVPDAPQVRMQGQTVTVELQAANLNIAINGVQALMHYNKNNLRLQSVTAAPNWIPVDPNTYQDINGDVRFAAIRPGGVGPGPGPYTVATLTFIALDVGTPRVSFLPDNPPAFPTLENAITRASDGLSMSPHELTNTVDGEIQITACTDYNPCTTDTFDPNSDPPECRSTPVSVDDGIACTIDACNPATGEITHAPNHAACSNGLYCDGDEVCDTVAGCVAGVAPNCDDNVGCTSDACNEDTDSCDHTPVNAACDDGLWCNGAETCDALLGCQAGTPPECDDNVGCTSDACNEDTDSCDHTPVNAACDDGLWCNGAETCDVLLGCQAGEPPNCDDGIDCTTDSCNEVADACDHTPVHALCDDGNPCTTDTCSTETGCGHANVPDATPCSDGLFCNGLETCVAGVCTDNADPCPPPLSCDETNDLCYECQSDGDCDDGLWCNGTETCNLDTHACVAGVAPNCDDNVGCTSDACNEDTDSCDHTPVNAACDDGLWCNGEETCNALLGCQAGTPPECNDNVGCTSDACNEATDSCDHTPVNAACDDGLWCNGAETCDVLLGCRAGTPPECNDNVGCTSDACNEDTDSCDHTPVNAACDDGLWCNGAETCDALLGCQAGTPPDCSDADPCTIDACDESTDTCSHTLSFSINVTIEVQALSHAVTRDVDFVLTDCDGVATIETRPVSFSSAGIGTAAIAVDDTSVDYIQIIEGHTLGRMMPVVFAGCSANVYATGTHRLLAGDFSNHNWVPQDNLVDIQDFAILAVYWNQPVNANLGTQADANGDGMQDAQDFTAIQANFARLGDSADECALLLRDDGGAQPQIQLVVAEMAMPFAARADRNSDGVINAADIRLFAAEKGLTLTPQFRATLDQMERAALRRK